jgi:hypothetical protein
VTGSGDGSDPATTLTLESFGLFFHVRASDPAILPMLDAYLPPGTTVHPRYTGKKGPIFSVKVGSKGAIVYVGAWKGSQATDLEMALRILESHIELYIAKNVRGRVFVHAGAVGWNGRGILLPGRSVTGKSTLVMELVRAGAQYYSDEYAVLDANGMLHSYPRPLHLRQDGSHRQQLCNVESLGGLAGTEAVPVGLVVLTEYLSGARWTPRELSAGEGLLRLLAHAITMRRRPAVVLSALQQLVSEAKIVESPRGEAPDAARDILRHAR